MRVFIKRIFIFLIPIFIISVIMEVMLRQIPNDYSFKNNYLKNHSNDIETLILGSSHSYFGLNPDYISPNSFNAAYVSQSLDLDLKVLKAYSWKNLRTIILPISYFTLFSKLEVGTESWRVKNYTLYYNFPPTKYSLSEDLEITNKLKTNLIRIGSYYFLNKEPLISSSLGWGKSYTSKKQQDLILSGQSAALRQTVENTDLLLLENTLTLQSIISFCKIKNIKLILFTPPGHEYYNKNLNVKQLDLMLKTIDNLKSNNNFTYINLLENPLFTKEDFYDADHLNEIGAKRLSLLIKKL